MGKQIQKNVYGRKEPVGYPVFIVLYRGDRRTLVCQPCLIMRLKRMNMNKEPDFFSNITPTSGGLIIIALGVLLLIGAIRRWKWVFDMTGERNKGFNFLLFFVRPVWRQRVEGWGDNHICHHHSWRDWDNVLL